MHDIQSDKKPKLTMDEDVFSSFGRHKDEFPVCQAESTTPVRKYKQIQPIGGTKEREALKTLFENRNKFQLIRLPVIPEDDIKHLSGLVRNYDYTDKLKLSEIKLKMEELSNSFEDEKLGQPEFQLVAEAENVKIDVILTFNPTLIEEGKKLKAKGIVKVKIMQPSEYVRDYL